MSLILRHPLLVEHQAPSTLVPNPHNARTHTKRQIRQIADSLESFGWVTPILVDAHNVIIDGHGLLAAANLLRMERVPITRIESLSTDQLRALTIARNRLAELGGWDKEILAIEFQRLLQITDVAIIGFEAPEIDLIVHGTQIDRDEDGGAALDPNLPAVSLHGDLWQLGRHRIGCLDATKGDSYEAVLQGSLVHLVFTDPPYNVKIDGHVSGKGRIKHREFPEASGEMTVAQFTEFLKRIGRHLKFNSHPGTVLYICMDWRHLHELLDACKGLFELLNLAVWVKNNGGMGSTYRSQHEFVVVLKHGGAPHTNNIQLGKFGRNRTNVWNYPNASTFNRTSEDGDLCAAHPTVKPVVLVADAILDCSNRGDAVLDPFLGSGTTLMAAERVGRVCFGMELDPLYVDLTIRRWQRLTGDSAIHIASGRTFDERAAAQEVCHDAA